MRSGCNLLASIAKQVGGSRQFPSAQKCEMVAITDICDARHRPKFSSTQKCGLVAICRRSPLSGLASFRPLIDAEWSRTNLGELLSDNENGFPSAHGCGVVAISSSRTAPTPSCFRSLTDAEPSRSSATGRICVGRAFPSAQRCGVVAICPPRRQQKERGSPSAQRCGLVEMSQVQSIVVRGPVSVRSKMRRGRDPTQS